MPKLNIDGVIYETDEFPDAAKASLAMMNAAKKKVDEAQVELAMRQASHNYFGLQLREQIAGVRPVEPPKVQLPPATKKPAPGKKPATGTRARKK